MTVSSEELKREIANLQRELAGLREANRALMAGEVDTLVSGEGGPPALVKEAQTALRQSEKLFRSVFDGALDAMIIADDGMRWLDVNPAACRLLGAPKQEIVGRTAADFATDDPAAVKEAWSTFLDTGEARGEISLRRPDGSVVETEFSATANVLPGRHLSVLRDITDRKRAEEAEGRLGRIIETTPVILFAVDENGIFTFSKGNEEEQQQTGPLIGQSIHEVFGDLPARLSTDERIPARMAFDRALDGEYVEYEIQWSERHYKVQLHPFEGESGFLGIAHNVTEQKEAKLELRKTRDTLAAIIDASQAAINTLDMEGNVTLWNKAAERFFGWTREEVLGRPLPSVDEAQFAKLLDELAEGRTISGRRVERLRKDGTSIELSFSGGPLRDPLTDELIGRVGIYLDVSKQLELEQQLEQANKMEAIGRLAGGVAHDFNNMLAAILGFATEARNELDEEHPIRADLNQVIAAGRRAAALTRQLLAFSSKQILDRRILDPARIVSELEPMLRRLIPENINLETRTGDSDLAIRADEAQLEQILLNLVVNARDAMPQGGRLRIDVDDVLLDAGEQTNLPLGRYVRFRVSDTGCGMDEETRKHIFEPFYTTKPGQQGTGLGLATVYGIVKQCQGSIAVESKPKEGTCFTLYFPAVEAQATDKKETPAGRETEAKSTGGETILVVEDERLIRQLVQKVLTRKGYHLLTAEDGVKALDRLETHDGSIDLLVTDVIMPNMGGPELARRLRKTNPDLKIVLATGYSEKDLAQEAQGLEAAWLAKPFEISELVRTVQDLINK